MWPATVTGPIIGLPPTRAVYVTVRCPGCRMVVDWLGCFEVVGGTRYVPGECLCGPVIVAA